MKTVQKGTEIKRIDDNEAELMVKNRGYKYVPKSAWKELTRPKKVVKEETPAAE
jgi:hypothetical protein